MDGATGSNGSDGGGDDDCDDSGWGDGAGGCKEADDWSDARSVEADCASEVCAGSACANAG